MEFTPIAVAAACASGLVMRRLRAPKLAAQAARGAFIVFEGIDRCGKTTQSETLVEKLRSEGVEVCHMRFPDRTTQVGTMINAYLTGGWRSTMRQCTCSSRRIGGRRAVRL